MNRLRRMGRCRAMAVRVRAMRMIVRMIGGVAVIVGMPVRRGHGQLSKTGEVERSGNPSTQQYVIL